MKKLIFSVIYLLSSSAIAQQWIALGGTSYQQHYIQENSLRISKSGNNETLSMTSQTVNRINNQVSYNNAFINSESCKQQQGTVTSQSLDGKKNVNNVFALGGKDFSSLIATAICRTYQNYIIPQSAQLVPKQTININTNIENNWHQVAINDKSEISLKIDSLSILKNPNGEELITIIGRNIDQKSKKVSLVNWSTSKSDCKRQQGKLITVNIDGKDQYDNNYVLGSGSLGSIIAEAICSFK